MTHSDFFSYHEAAFDAFCKKVIRNAARQAHRKNGTLKQNRQLLNDTMEQHLAAIQFEDTYSTYSRTFHVRNLKIIVRDEAVGEALQFIMPTKRAILLLSYFGNFSDAEIAMMFHMTAANVGYHRRGALAKLRALLEARNYGK